ncbi:MAG TPA: MFS transporter [Usitatibacter sp.]|nr:MFS transporter [Usitatibacter sp.]
MNPLDPREMRMDAESRYGWVMVAAGALMGCMAVGAMFSLAVFLQPMTESTGWSRAAISSAMTLNFLIMGAAGFAWGALSDRFGPRIVVLAGSVLLGLALVLASRATSQLEFQLVYGVLVGVSAGSFFAPMIAAVSAWFERHRGLAVSLVSAGVGVAPMTVSPLAAWLLTTSDWRSAQMTIGLLVWALLIPACFLVREAPRDAAGRAASPDGPAETMTVSRALRSWPFVVLSATFFACCAAHSGPIFHTVSYAMGCGLPAIAAVSIYSVEGIGGLFGRVVLGALADRYGAKRLLIAGLVLQAIGAGAFVMATRLHEFYGVASVFGFAYGGTMPLYAVLARHYFGQQIMGTVLGAAAMVSSLGMALGPSLGGWIFDTYRSYTALYVGSLAVGLAAVAIAMALPRAQAAAMRLRPA